MSRRFSEQRNNPGWENSSRSRRGNSNYNTGNDRGWNEPGQRQQDQQWGLLTISSLMDRITMPVASRIMKKGATGKTTATGTNKGGMSLNTPFSRVLATRATALKTAGGMKAGGVNVDIAHRRILVILAIGVMTVHGMRTEVMATHMDVKGLSGHTHQVMTRHRAA